MFPKSEVIETYCIADDFCKEFASQQKKYTMEDKKTTTVISRTSLTLLRLYRTHVNINQLFSNPPEERNA